MLLDISPGASLLIGIGVLALLLWFFWPRQGLLSKWTKSSMNTQRVLLEDALKFVFDCEYKNVPCGLNSIAGNLNISTDKTARLLDRLRDMGLISMQEQQFELTDTGRSYALRIIRVHRIWERYLADETGLGEREWHGEADYKEHLISIEAANKLAEQLGNPVFDPHGDPIPSKKGELPDHRGQALSSLEEGDIARIVHIEDEPPAIYEQLVAWAFIQGWKCMCSTLQTARSLFAADGEERILTSLFASSITVELIPEKEEISPKNEVLASLKIGEKAKILGISPNCRGQQRRRLMDLGIVPGTIISAEMQSASGDPLGFRILGATIAIRKSQTQFIFIKKIEKEVHEPTA
jgi:DtxR family Mn-dependent transcriptional regulator